MPLVRNAGLHPLPPVRMIKLTREQEIMPSAKLNPKIVRQALRLAFLSPSLPKTSWLVPGRNICHGAIPKLLPIPRKLRVTL
jgi:hypothetical protein